MKNMIGIQLTRRHYYQILFWGILWMIIISIFSANNGNPFFVIRMPMLVIGSMLICFVNFKFLFYKYFVQGKYWKYGIYSALFLISFSFLVQNGTYYFFKFIYGDHYFQNYLAKTRNVTPFLLTLIISSLSEFSHYNNKNKQERLDVEMKFLKSQINPHFLFNTLNNIYTLTLLKSDNAPESLMKLSKMLRYVLYDCSDQTVPIEKEVEYINSYFDLIQLKDSDGLKIILNFSTLTNLRIAPMIFITFIENAVKHSKIEDLENGWIDLFLGSSGEIINFQLKNSIPISPVQNTGIGGVGLKNIQRQLDVLYPKMHQLKIETTQQQFSISLEIDTSSKVKKI